MRRWLAIVLLVLLPIQFSWAAAAGYCQHESEPTSQHVGHHAHQHPAAADEAGHADPSLPGDEHPDCGFCHLGCAKTLVSDVQLHSPPMSEPQVRFTQRSYLSQLQERIERPNWQRAA